VEPFFGFISGWVNLAGVGAGIYFAVHDVMASSMGLAAA